jgi:hypothetical protein
VGLSDDQRAMLRLLAQREEGYEDIAALLGVSVDEVRGRVKEALSALDEEGSAVGPVAAGDPPPPAVAEASSGVGPPAAPPTEETSRSKEARPTRSRQPPTPPSAAPARPRIQLPKDRRRLVELVGGAIVVLLFVLFVTGAVDIGGGDDSDSDTASSAGANGTATAAANDSRFTQAVLEPVGGGDASGLARFGRVRNAAVLQVEAEGLEPSPPGQLYTVWLYSSPKLVLRVGAVKVTESGGIAAQFPIPAELLAVVSNRAFDQIDISLTPNAAYKAELARAREQKRLPTYTGESILRGEITGPLVKG